jgi:hypothetical protein
LDAQLLQTAHDVGGWVFASATITAGSLFIIRYQFRLLSKALEHNQQMAVAMAQMTSAVDALVGQVSRLDPPRRR